MKWLTMEQFKKLKLPTSTDFEKIEQRAVEVNKFYPAKIMVCVDDSEGLHFNYAEVRLEHPDIVITIRYDEYRKKYEVGANIESHFKNVTWDTVLGIKRSLHKPNQIGVLSAKKITEWVNYYEAIYSQAFRIDQQNGNEKERFLLSLKGLPVKWNADKKGGTIIKNGITFTFSIGATYVTKKMEINYNVPDTIESFKLISDNKYKEK